MRLSILLPTFGREQILIDTIACLLVQNPAADEVLVMDQTPGHESGVQKRLEEWSRIGAIRWIRLPEPGIPAAMNRGLLEARGDAVLFLDDDIVPGTGLVGAHVAALVAHPEAWAVVGQVLQPGRGGEGGVPRAEWRGRSAEGMLREDLDFPFYSLEPAWVRNVMAGNLSVRRDKALAVGGFDENFKAVAFRFETEFCRRLWANGGKVWYEPAASIRHLRAPVGGTRRYGSHLTSASPAHGMGDYYFALRCGTAWDRLAYMVRRPFREVCTKFHLTRPWWIPIKLIGEFRALVWAVRLYRKGPAFLAGKGRAHD